MKIASIQIQQVRVRRQHRTVVGSGVHTAVASAGDAPTLSRFAFLQLYTDEGLCGLGEWSDLEPELDPARLQGQLEALLLGRSPFDLESIFAAFPLDRSTRCAVDSALYDLQGKTLGVPVYQLLGGRCRAQVEVSWVVYIRQPELIAAEIQAMSAQGFTAFKLKVGSRIEHDEQCVGIIRQRAVPQAQLKLDASGAWTLAEAVEYIPRLAQYGL
jgi:muconate cycloisomerase